MASRIKALGEIALRVNDMDAMRGFYRDVIGLELLRDFPNATFFRIADGHTQALALFDRSDRPDYDGPDRKRTSLDHIAFAISRRKRRGSKATASKFKPANTPGSTGAASTCATPRGIRLNWFVTTTAWNDPFPLGEGGSAIVQR